MVSVDTQTDGDKFLMIFDAAKPPRSARTKRFAPSTCANGCRLA
jgi:hypothetical protein